MDVLPLGAQDVMEALRNSIEEFISECTLCGSCLVCPYLERYGLPSEIIQKGSESVFLCTNCTACSRVCPQGLKPSEALFGLKYELIKKGRLPEKTEKAVESSRRFAMRGHRFPFVYYPETETAFWPGCSLQGTRPDIVKKVPEILKEKYGEVGIALDCCFDPAFQNGDLDSVKSATERIKERIKSKGIKKLILGCTNCKKIFNLYMPEIEVEHILDALPDVKPEGSPDYKEVFIHHPCPSFRFEALQKEAYKKVSAIFSVTGQGSLPMCCGLGGLSHSISRELSEEFTQRVLDTSDNRVIITYCMGCKNRYLRMGKRAYHILESLTGIRPLERPVDSKKKWLNRLILSASLRLKSKRTLTALLLILAILVVTYLRSEGYITIETVIEFIKAHPFMAPFLFIILYSIGPSLFIPSLPLTIGAGFLWGPFWGVVFSITGATIGATVPFLLSRYIIGDTVRARFGYIRWQWLKEKVEKHGWKAVAFARLLPVLPFPVLNYLFGITPIPLRHYIWSSLVFMVPACIAYVVFGSSMSELIIKGNIKAIILGILVVSVMMLLPFIFKPLFRRFYGEKS
jgi:uncharacterized membrane protein YdjX (TVP38/TMEM64 family)/Fe-S oxidoreductase